jgi:hypothetical protein
VLGDHAKGTGKLGAEAKTDHRSAELPRIDSELDASNVPMKLGRAM